MPAIALVIENEKQEAKQYQTLFKQNGFAVVGGTGGAKAAIGHGGKAIVCIVSNYQAAVAALAVKPHVIVCDHDLGLTNRHGSDLLNQGASLVPQPLWLLVTGDESIFQDPAYTDRYDQTYLKEAGGIREAVEDVTFFATASPRGDIILPPARDMPPCERVFVVSPTASLDEHWYFSKMGGLLQRVQKQRAGKHPPAVIVYRGSIVPLSERQGKGAAFQALLRLKHIAMEGKGNVDLRRLNTPKLDESGAILGLLNDNSKNTSHRDKAIWMDRNFPSKYAKVGLSGLKSAFAGISFRGNKDIPTGFDPSFITGFDQATFDKSTPKRELDIARESLWGRCEFVYGDENLDYAEWQKAWSRVSRESYPHLFSGLAP